MIHYKQTVPNQTCPPVGWFLEASYDFHARGKNDHIARELTPILSASSALRYTKTIAVFSI